MPNIHDEFRTQATTLSLKIEGFERQLRKYFGKAEFAANFSYQSTEHTLRWCPFGPRGWCLNVIKSISDSQPIPRQLTNCSVNLKIAAIHTLPQLLNHYEQKRESDLKELLVAHHLLDDLEFQITESLSIQEGE